MLPVANRGGSISPSSELFASLFIVDAVHDVWA